MTKSLKQQFHDECRGVLKDIRTAFDDGEISPEQAVELEYKVLDLESQVRGK